MGLLVASMLIVMAAEGTTSVEPLAVLANYGLAGVMLGLFIFGKLHGDPELKALKEQNEKLMNALVNVQNSLSQQALPALNRSSQALEVSTADVVKDIRSILARLEGLQ